MNKTLFVGVLVLAGCLLSKAASQDFVKGVDFTARATITQSALNQLVDNATVATNRGLTIFTNGAPSVAADPKLVRYIWLDSSVYPPAVKTYNTNSGLWVASTIGTGAVGTAQLADSAVTTVKIANSAVDNSKLADDSVTSAKIVDGTIIAGDLAANSVINSKIAAGSVNGTSLGTNVILNSHLTAGIIYPSNLASGVSFNISLGANSIYNSNLTASVIQNTNIAPNSISNNLLSADSVSYANISTNINYLLPRFWMLVQSDGTILRQVLQPGLSVNTAAKVATGKYAVTFGSPLSGTNYSFSINAHGTSGVGYIGSTTNQAAGSLGVTIFSDGSTAVDQTFSLTVWGF